METVQSLVEKVVKGQMTAEEAAPQMKPTKVSVEQMRKNALDPKRRDEAAIEDDPNSLTYLYAARASKSITQDEYEIMAGLRK